MKMLYLYIGGGVKMTSVQKKIVAKINRFNDKGIDTEGIFLSYQVDKPTALNERIELRPLQRASQRFFTAIHQRKANGIAASKLIVEVKDEYDVIYFRYPGANKHLLDVLKKVGHKMLFEHNSKEVEELSLAGQSIFFGLRPSTLIPWLQDKIWAIRNEYLVGPEMLMRVKMGLAVTDDMAQYEVDRAEGRYKCVGNANGVDVKSVPLRTAAPYDGKEIRMIFMRGASTNAPYHGVDRLLEGLRDYNGRQVFKLYLVGSIFEKEKEWLAAQNITAEVVFTGPLYGDDLSSLFDDCHLSFGSLGLHRIKMREGSVLKVNESLARGMPLVVAYEDMELSRHEEYEPYHLCCPADDSPIDMGAVASFVQEVHANENHPEQMRELAMKYTDYDVKIERAAKIILENFQR